MIASPGTVGTVARPPRPLFGQAAWTIGSYGASLVLRLGSNVILSRLLMPEILGTMVVVNSIRYGIELLTDVGIEQNIVVNKDGLEPDFFNTAWTLQIIRGAFLSAVFMLLTPLLASFYGIDPWLFLTMSFAPLLNSLASTSIFVLVKRLELRQRNLFELAAELCGFLASVTLALITPTAWAPVLGILFALVARSALSYLLPHPTHRLVLRRPHVLEILRFGKWIMISSLVIYASTNLDRIYLGKMEMLAVLGIYGLARTIADLPPTLANRLSYQLIVPLIARARAREESIAQGELAIARWRLVLLAALGMGTAMAWSDCAVGLLYDPRYAAAGWMLFVLLCGAWFAVLSSLNEAVLLGFGRPAYGSAANAVRFVALATGLPLAYAAVGLTGAVAAISASEVIRYFAVAVGQRRLGHGFWGQDAAATALTVLVMLGWVLARDGLSLGLPWSGIIHAPAP